MNFRATAALKRARSKDSATRNNTLTALRRLGTAAAPAVPSLIELIEHNELKMNPSVIEVFFNVGPAASQAIPLLTKATASKDAVLRVMAAVALGRIQGDVESTFPVLISALRNDQFAKEQTWEVWLPNMHIIGYDHRMTAAWFLGEIGPSAKDAVPELTNAMQGKQLRLPVLAARAIWKITGRDGNVLNVLSRTLQNPDEIACVLAVQALGEMGADAKPVVPALLNARTNSLYVRRAVNEALKRIDSETAEKAIYQGPR